MDAQLPLSAPPLLAPDANEQAASQSVTLRFRCAFNPLHQVVGRASESWRGVPVVLLHPIVHITAGAVTDVGSQCLADGPWVGVVAIRRHLLGGLSDHRV